jgi:RNA polymerase sigma-B factor
MKVSVRLQPLIQASENELAERYHSSGDLDARGELVQRFMPLVRDLAYRYSYARERIEDLIQVGSIGLLKAIDRYEPGRSARFASYAAPTILGELRRHFRDKGWAVHVPRRLQERLLRVNREVEELSRRLGRSPTPAEVAGALGWAVEDVLEALEVARGHDAISLDAPISTAEDGGASLGDAVGSLERGYDAVEVRAEIAARWRDLSELEMEVLRLRLVADMSQREIGERVGCSQMHVSRLLRRALERLDQDDE